MPPSALGFELLPSGAAWWPARRTLVLADLHLEKGSSRAVHGHWLPPYDTAHTLQTIHHLIETHTPQLILCLGDAFEDPQAWHRMDSADRTTLLDLTRQCPWVWIAGNHDPRSPDPVLGTFLPEMEIEGITFTHQPSSSPDLSPGPRVFAHFHPKATLLLRGKRVTGRCFLATESDLLLPALGAYVGGLDRHDPAIRGALRGKIHTWILHKNRTYACS
jgi:DNA ligase-associated metallophosphoesterase